MPKETMHRTASDNVYFHRDFHGALSASIDYLHETYGEESVREYLWQFAKAYYAPLTASLESRGLVAIEEHFRKVYELEGGTVRFDLSEDELRIEVDACPAVTHMRRQGYGVARLFRETTGTVNEAICDDTAYRAELVEYDDATGRSVQRFCRREQP